MFGCYIIEISSSIIAFSALLFSIISFHMQQKKQDELQKASVKPMLTIKSLIYINKKSIEILNSGVGPAIIKDIRFYKNDKSYSNIVELFELGKITWDSFSYIPTGKVLNNSSKIVLVELSQENLMKSNKIKNKEALKILAEWQNQKSGITITIDYEDILGNKMNQLKEVLN